MGFLIIPGLFFFLAAPLPGPPAHALADFSRISKAINQQITLAEFDGAVHKGVLTAASDEQVSLRIGADDRTFSRANVASAARPRDSRIDGVVKGVLVGAVMAALAGQGCDSTTRCHPWKVVGFTAGVGYWLDAEESHPRALYRAPAAKLKVRF